MDANEVAVRVEAVAKFVLQLAAELEIAGLIDGTRFCDRLRGSARMQDQSDYIRGMRICIEHMADQLDQARAHRAAQ